MFPNKHAKMKLCLSGDGKTEFAQHYAFLRNPKYPYLKVIGQKENYYPEGYLAFNALPQFLNDLLFSANFRST